MKAILDWAGKMSFRAAVRQHTVAMDAKRLAGGDDSAPTPKELVLSGLLGCTAMDVVSLLRKAKTTLASFEVEAEASQTDGEPAVFDAIKLIYKANGEVPGNVLLDAISASQTRYCGVSAMIAKTARIDYEVLLNGVSIGLGKAQFPIA